MMRTFTSICVMTWLLVTALTHSAMAAVCSNPGVDGPASISGIVNSYYPGSGTVSAGSASIPVSIAGKRGATASIKAGDLIMIIQMQDADIDSSNTSAYGGSAPGTGYTTLNNSGAYEYAVVASGYTTGTSPISITAPLQNSYRNQAATGTAGQRTYQVVRIPQYSSAAFGGGTVYVAPPWDGSTGGLVAFDVGGNLSWGGSTIEVSGRGFRGGAGRSIGGATGFAATDYRTAATSNPNGSKGEGIAGTPRYVFTPDSASTANYITNNAGASTDTGIDGYPNGSRARGAPGNAGGGGSDGNPSANDQNTGGGGGGSYAVGGMGGYGWTPGTPPGSMTGGFGGYSVPMGPGLLTMGGGGGAGAMNNNTGTPGGLSTSGGAGGGIVIIRARTITGTGTINANGTNANNSITNDASGGGGAGGAVLVFATNNNGSLGSLTINARGGNGGTNTGNGSPHGPGGGGSGGFIAVTTASGIAIDVTAGTNGTTATSTTSTAEYGSTASSGGYRIYSLQPVDIPGAGANALCSPLLTVSKTTAKAETVQGGTTSYTITVTNASGYGTATGVILSDTLPGLPSPFTYASTDSITLSGGALRIGGSNPVSGSALSWGSFSIPGGGSVAIRFTVNVPTGTTLATYQNSATVVYDDPTRTSAGQTVTPGGSYAGSGTVPGSNYAFASSTLEDVTVWAPATIAKSFFPASITSGGTSALSIVITNSNSVAMNNAAFTDSYPAGLVNTASPGGAISGTGCYGTVTAASGGSSVALSGGVIPAGGSCTVSVNVTFSVSGNFINTIPAGAITSNRNITTISPASASLNQTAIQPPVIAKTFSPAQIQQGATSTLALTVSNGGTTALTGIAFSDTLTNMQVAATPAVTNSCGGTLTATAGSSSITLAGGALGAGATCTITVQITSNTISSAGGHANTITGITSTQSGAGANSNTAYLVVAGTPTIAKAFAATTIAPGSATSMTFTITNPGNIPLTNATFSDNMGNLKIAATGAAGGSCGGAAGNMLNAGTSSIMLSGLTIPAAGSCTVTVQVTGTVPGLQTNIANGVSSTETPAPGNQSAPATITVLHPPQIAKSFFPGTIQSGGTSTVTLMLTNLNSIQLDGVVFTDTLTNMRINASGSAGGTCSGASGNSFTAAQTGLLTFSGITIPAGGSCTVTFVVSSSSQSPAGGHPNTVSGATSTQTGTVVAGAPDTAYLTVLLPPTISKEFSPNSIDTSTGVTVMTLTLTNPNSIPLTGGTLTDNFPANLTTTNVAQNYIGAGRGTCTGAIPSSQIAGTYYTNRTFSGITIPAGGSCTIMVNMRSATAGVYTNSISGGMTTVQTPTAGAASNAATLSVGRIGITKTFSPATIVSGGTSTVTFTLNNQSGGNRTAVTFRDLLPSSPAQMRIATPLTTTSNCNGTLVDYNNTTGFIAANDTGFRLIGGTLADNATCTVTVLVTAPSAGIYNNNSTNLGYSGGGVGPNSNVAVLTVVDRPTIATAFTPAAIDVYGTSTITFTLTNPNGIKLTTANFTDTLAGFAVASPATSGGTCTGVASSPALVSGATSLNLTVPNLLPGSCTITIPVTGSIAGTYPNTASGITTDQTGATAGATSNTASLTVNRLPLQVTKVPNVTTASPGTLVSYDIGYSNPNVTTPLQNVIITDPVPIYTTFDSASCGSLPTGITSCSVAFTPPPAGFGNGTASWSLGGSLAAGSSGTVRLTVRIQ